MDAKSRVQIGANGLVIREDKNVVLGRERCGLAPRGNDLDRI